MNEQNFHAMKTIYVSLITFTDQGIRAIAQSPKRAAAFRKRAKAAGVKILSQLWTYGSCDGVLILEGDETKILSVLAQLTAAGNVRTHTLRAFDAAGFATITGS